ncbi:MAG: tetratricopeptide repeat protein, partial [Actinomycetota bacterium]
VDHAPMLSSRFQVQGIPAVKAFVDGKQAAEFVGAQPKHQVEAWLKGFLPDPSEKLVSVAQAAELQGDLKSARAMYEKALKMSPSSQSARQGLQRLDLVENSSNADEAALSDRLELEPLDIEAAGDLAELRLSRSDPDFAEPLIRIIESEDSEAGDLARKLLLQIMAPFDAGDPRILTARRRLASVLYR